MELGAMREHVGALDGELAVGILVGKLGDKLHVLVGKVGRGFDDIVGVVRFTVVRVSEKVVLASVV